ncbi:MAG: hypothetical protein WAW37_15145 [Syntrophobacteraceae bacterium]
MRGPPQGIVEFIKRLQGASPAAEAEKRSFLPRQRQIAVNHREHRLFVFGQFSTDVFKQVDVVC